MDELATLPALSMVEKYKDRSISPVDVITATFDRIKAFEHRVNAFTLTDEESAFEAAQQSEKRWKLGKPLSPLDGVPATIKDLLLTKNWPTLRGSSTSDKSVAWNEDSPSTARLREAGCVLIGKTTTPEFGWKGVTDSPLSGITSNPWNTKMTPGGSSGGAAVAASLGMGALHVGTDGGGSIRIPAAFTGVFGFKPTFGLVPSWPPSPFSAVAHVGPLTRTVADAAAMLKVLARPDIRDFHCQPFIGENFSAKINNPVDGLRMAFSPDLGYAEVDPEIMSIVDRAVKIFLQLGAIVEIATPNFANSLEIFNIHWYAAAAQLLNKFNENQKQLIDPGLVEIAAQGAKIPLMEYLTATNARVSLAERAHIFHEKWDILLTPTLPIPAFPSGKNIANPETQSQWPDWTPLSYPFNLTNQPACSVPCGLTKANLPVGLQIIGPKYSDSLVLRVASAFEQVAPFPMLNAPIESK